MNPKRSRAQPVAQLLADDRDGKKLDNGDPDLVLPATKRPKPAVPVALNNGQLTLAANVVRPSAVSNNCCDSTVLAPAALPSSTPVSDKLFIRSPTIGMLRLTGLPLINTDRFSKIDFVCQQCLYSVKKALCIGAPMRGRRKRDPSTTPPTYYYVWIVRGQFCTISCVARYVKENRREMHSRKTMPLLKLMTIQAYGCKQTIPIAPARSTLPPFKVGLTSASDQSSQYDRLNWTIDSYRKALYLPLQAPNPDMHRFYDEPSCLLVDAMQTNVSDIRKWYMTFAQLYPQFLYARDYASELVTVPVAPRSTPTGLASPTHEPLVPATDTAGDILLTPTAALKRGRGRPRKAPPVLPYTTNATTTTATDGTSTNAATPVVVNLNRPIALHMDNVTSVLNVDAFALEREKLQATMQLPVIAEK